MSRPLTDLPVGRDVALAVAIAADLTVDVRQHLAVTGHDIPWLTIRLASAPQASRFTRPRQNAQMSPSVEDSWDRIVAWLRGHAPVSAAHLGPSATKEEITVVEALLGRPLPADLLAWWRQSCGSTGFVEGRLIPPRYSPYTIDEAVDCREQMLEVASCDDDAETAALVAERAGSPCTPYWLPAWLPIAHDGGGCYLFTDLRPGPLSGCVMAWDKCEAASLKPQWPAVATMHAEIADALEHGTDIQGYQPEAGDDGTLDWV